MSGSTSFPSPFPLGTIFSLNHQFALLKMSSDNPAAAAVHAQPSASSMFAPLPPATRMALIKVLETFGSAVVNVPDSGHLTNICYTFENSVKVRSIFPSVFFRFLFISVLSRTGVRSTPVVWMR